MYVDRFSRYVILDKLKDRTSESVARSLVDCVISEYNAPQTLTSDNASELCSNIMIDTYKLFGIKHSRITPYHPQSNGLAERNNQKVLRILRTVTAAHQKDWDEYLKLTQSAINSAFNSTIGDSPHFVVFLNDKILPQDRLLQLEDEEEIKTTSEYLKTMLQKKQYCYEVVMKNIEEQESEYVAKHNRDATPTEWLEGSRVYIESVVPPGKSKKLFKRFIGPYRVMRKIENERYILKDLHSGKEKQVHSDRMKPVLES